MSPSKLLSSSSALEIHSQSDQASKTPRSGWGARLLPPWWLPSCLSRRQIPQRPLHYLKKAGIWGVLDCMVSKGREVRFPYPSGGHGLLRHRANGHVSLKILRADAYNGNHHIFELELLQAISRIVESSQSPGRKHVLGFLDHFHLNGPNGQHVCLVSKVLGCHLGLQADHFRLHRLPVRIVKEVAKQLFMGLDFLHRECGIIHTGMFTPDFPDVASGNPIMTNNLIWRVQTSSLPIFY